MPTMVADAHHHNNADIYPPLKKKGGFYATVKKTNSYIKGKKQHYLSQR